MWIYLTRVSSCWVCFQQGRLECVLECYVDWCGLKVGTGLGPTLEFYALVSREMQNVELELWRGEPVKRNEVRDDGHAYMFNAVGLFPAPLARNAKMSHVNKIKSKFRFLGKFMAKALMDSRMVSTYLATDLILFTLLDICWNKWLCWWGFARKAADLGREYLQCMIFQGIV